jgi:hypothetical protein
MEESLETSISNNPDNPSEVISPELCRAYRETVSQRFETIEQKIDGLRGTFITSISIAAFIISTIVVVANLF